MANETTPAPTPTLEELQAQVEVQGEIIAEQEQTINALKVKVAALESASTRVARPTAGAVAAKHGKKDYVVVHGIRARDEHGNLRDWSKEEIARTPALLEELIATGSTSVRPA